MVYIFDSLQIKDYFDIVESMVVITASIITAWSIKSWRREIKWKRKYELSEEAIYLSYLARESIRYIRNPFYYLNEGETKASIIWKRYQEEKEVFAQLQKIKYRFKAIFAPTALNAFDEFEKIINEIKMAGIHLNKTYWPNQGQPMTEAELNKHLKEMHHYESIIWYSGASDDPIEHRLLKAINEIENLKI